MMNAREVYSMKKENEHHEISYCCPPKSLAMAFLEKHDLCVVCASCCRVAVVREDRWLADENAE
jgi:hypothetical protein